MHITAKHMYVQQTGSSNLVELMDVLPIYTQYIPKVVLAHSAAFQLGSDLPALHSGTQSHLDLSRLSASDQECSVQEPTSTSRVTDRDPKKSQSLSLLEPNLRLSNSLSLCMPSGLHNVKDHSIRMRKSLKTLKQLSRISMLNKINQISSQIKSQSYLYLENKADQKSRDTFKKASPNEIQH